MSKIVATIELNDGTVIRHQFDHKYVSNVYQTCRKELGGALATTMENGQLFWRFQHGRVSLEGNGFRHHHGYRTIKEK